MGLWVKYNISWTQLTKCNQYVHITTNKKNEWSLSKPCPPLTSQGSLGPPPPPKAGCPPAPPPCIVFKLLPPPGWNHSPVGDPGRAPKTHQNCQPIITVSVTNGSTRCLRCHCFRLHYSWSRQGQDNYAILWAGLADLYDEVPATGEVPVSKTDESWRRIAGRKLVV